MNKLEYARLNYKNEDGTIGLTQEELAVKAKFREKSLGIRIIKRLEDNKPVKLNFKVMVAAALDLSIPAHALQDPMENADPIESIDSINENV